MVESGGIRISHPRASIPGLGHTNCVSLSKFLHLSDPVSSFVLSCTHEQRPLGAYYMPGTVLGAGNPE